MAILRSEINIQFKRTTTIPNTLQQNVHAVITDCALKTQRIMFMCIQKTWTDMRKNVVNKKKHHLTNKTVNIHHHWLKCCCCFVFVFFYSRTYKTISLADGLSEHHI